MTFRFLSIFAGRPTMTDLPVRSPGFIMSRIAATPIGAWILEYDGYWMQLSGDSTSRTVGNASSGASTNQSWAQTLFTLVWDNYTQTQCPVLTSTGGASTRGASATADWNANKRLTLPDFRGRTFMGAGTAPGGTARVAGSTIGQDTVTLDVTNLPPHSHNLYGRGTTGGSFNAVNVATDGAGSYLGGQPYVQSVGGGQAFSVVNSSHVVNYWISAGAR